MTERLAGVAIPLFSLRRPAGMDTGCGGIGDLPLALQLFLRFGHRLIQLLPLDEVAPGQSSPYSSLSVLAIDPIYVALEGLSRAELRRAVRPHLRRRGRAPYAGSVDRERARVVKSRYLVREYRRFRAAGTPSERARFEAYAEANRSWLADYALFRALKERFGWSAWEKWPAPLRRHDADALSAARSELADSVSMHCYWQFVAAEQWRRVRQRFADAGAFLGGDIAFSPARDSAEVWANQDLFDLERSVGAPPDAFSDKGQRWGLPMPNWERMRARNFDLLRLRAEKAAERFDVIRIDHVVGLYRTYSVGPNPDETGHFEPADEPAQRRQGEEVLRAIQESARGATVIAEDLGVVPDWVRESLAACSIAGYKVVRWEKSNRGLPDEGYIDPQIYPELSVATTGTHDTECLVEWWRTQPERERTMFVKGLRIAERLAPERQPLDTLGLDAILEALYAAPSHLAIVPVQDLFGWRTRINLPATLSQANWSFRLPMALERMLEDGSAARRAAQLCAIVERTGRR